MRGNGIAGGREGGREEGLGKIGLNRMLEKGWNAKGRKKKGFRRIGMKRMMERGRGEES